MGAAILNTGVSKTLPYRDFQDGSLHAAEIQVTHKTRATHR